MARADLSFGSRNDLNLQQQSLVNTNFTWVGAQDRTNFPDGTPQPGISVAYQSGDIVIHDMHLYESLVNDNDNYMPMGRTTTQWRLIAGGGATSTTPQFISVADQDDRNDLNTTTVDVGDVVFQQDTNEFYKVTLVPSDNSTPTFEQILHNTVEAKTWPARPTDSTENFNLASGGIYFRSPFYYAFTGGAVTISMDNYTAYLPSAQSEYWHIINFQATPSTYPTSFDDANDALFNIGRGTLWETGTSPNVVLWVFVGTPTFVNSDATRVTNLPSATNSDWYRLGAEALNSLTDVTISNPGRGQGLVYNGTNWVNQSVSGGATIRVDDRETFVLASPGIEQNAAVINFHFDTAAQGQDFVGFFHLGADDRSRNSVVLTFTGGTATIPMGISVDPTANFATSPVTITFSTEALADTFFGAVPDNAKGSTFVADTSFTIDDETQLGADVEFIAGDGITLDADAQNDTITINSTGGIPNWSNVAAYEPARLVIYNDRIYESLIAIPAGVVGTNTNPTPDTDHRWADIAESGLTESRIPNWSATEGYAPTDVVVYNNIIYRATQSLSANPVMDLLGRVRNVTGLPQIENQTYTGGVNYVDIHWETGQRPDIDLNEIYTVTYQFDDPDESGFAPDIDNLQTLTFRGTAITTTTPPGGPTGERWFIRVSDLTSIGSRGFAPVNSSGTRLRFFAQTFTSGTPHTTPDVTPTVWDRLGTSVIANDTTGTEGDPLRSINIDGTYHEVAGGISAFNDNDDYQVNDIVTYRNQLYTANRAVTGSDTTNLVDLTSLVENIFPGFDVTDSATHIPQIEIQFHENFTFVDGTTYHLRFQDANQVNGFDTHSITFTGNLARVVNGRMYEIHVNRAASGETPNGYVLEYDQGTNNFNTVPTPFSIVSFNSGRFRVNLYSLPLFSRGSTEPDWRLVSGQEREAFSDLTDVNVVDGTTSFLQWDGDSVEPLSISELQRQLNVHNTQIVIGDEANFGFFTDGNTTRFFSDTGVAPINTSAVLDGGTGGTIDQTSNNLGGFNTLNTTGLTSGGLVEFITNSMAATRVPVIVGNNAVRLRQGISPGSANVPVGELENILTIVGLHNFRPDPYTTYEFTTGPNDNLTHWVFRGDQTDFVDIIDGSQWVFANLNTVQSPGVYANRPPNLNLGLRSVDVGNFFTLAPVRNQGHAVIQNLAVPNQGTSNVQLNFDYFYVGNEGASFTLRRFNTDPMFSALTTENSIIGMIAINMHVWGENDDGSVNQATRSDMKVNLLLRTNAAADPVIISNGDADTQPSVRLPFSFDIVAAWPSTDDVDDTSSYDHRTVDNFINPARLNGIVGGTTIGGFRLLEEEHASNIDWFNLPEVQDTRNPVRSGDVTHQIRPIVYDGTGITHVSPRDPRLGRELPNPPAANGHYALNVQEGDDDWVEVNSAGQLNLIDIARDSDRSSEIDITTSTPGDTIEVNQVLELGARSRVETVTLTGDELTPEPTGRAVTFTINHPNINPQHSFNPAFGSFPASMQVGYTPQGGDLQVLVDGSFTSVSTLQTGAGSMANALNVWANRIRTAFAGNTVTSNWDVFTDIGTAASGVSSLTIIDPDLSGTERIEIRVIDPLYNSTTNTFPDYPNGATIDPTGVTVVSGNRAQLPQRNITEAQDGEVSWSIVPRRLEINFAGNLTPVQLDPIGTINITRSTATSIATLIPLIVSAFNTEFGDNGYRAEETTAGSVITVTGPLGQDFVLANSYQGNTAPTEVVANSVMSANNVNFNTQPSFRDTPLLAFDFVNASPGGRIVVNDDRSGLVQAAPELLIDRNSPLSVLPTFEENDGNQNILRGISSAVSINRTRDNLSVDGAENVYSVTTRGPTGLPQIRLTFEINTGDGSTIDLSAVRADHPLRTLEMIQAGGQGMLFAPEDPTQSYFYLLQPGTGINRAANETTYLFEVLAIWDGASGFNVQLNTDVNITISSTTSDGYVRLVESIVSEDVTLPTLFNDAAQTSFDTRGATNNVDTDYVIHYSHSDGETIWREQGSNEYIEAINATPLPDPSGNTPIAQTIASSKLTFDTAPVNGGTNPLTSGAIHTALSNIPTPFTPITATFNTPVVTTEVTLGNLLLDPAVTNGLRYYPIVGSGLTPSVVGGGFSTALNTVRPQNRQDGIFRLDQAGIYQIDYTIQIGGAGTIWIQRFSGTSTTPSDPAHYGGASVSAGGYITGSAVIPSEGLVSGPLGTTAINSFRFLTSGQTPLSNGIILGGDGISRIGHIMVLTVTRLA